MSCPKCEPGPSKGKFWLVLVGLLVLAFVGVQEWLRGDARPSPPLRLRGGNVDARP